MAATSPPDLHQRSLARSPIPDRMTHPSTRSICARSRQRHTTRETRTTIHSRDEEHARHPKEHRRELHKREQSVSLKHDRSAGEASRNHLAQRLCAALAVLEKPAENRPFSSRPRNVRVGSTYVGNTATAPMYMNPPATNGITCKPPPMSAAHTR